MTDQFSGNQESPDAFAGQTPASRGDVPGESSWRQASVPTAQLLFKALEALPELLFVVDRQLRVVTCNQADFPSFLHSGCHARLRDDGQLGQPQGHCILDQGCPFKRVFQTGRRCQTEFVHPADGCIQRVVASPILDERGLVSLVVGQVYDVTEEKRSEREIKHYAAALESTNRALEEFCEVAEATSRAKTEFLASMSHEIRTPMTAILGFTETLLDASVSDDDRLDAVRTIQRNGEHLLEILNAVLDWSKIEAGKLLVERIDCSPAELVADVQALMRERARRKGLSFEVVCQNRIPRRINTDPTRLRQILINLVGNAIKFTAQGEVRLVLGMCECRQDEPTLLFEVVDTGVGMSPEQLGRLFVPFVQADVSTTRQFGGTGLGLAICRQLLDELGGEIAVESQPGQGSTFRVWLPTGTAGNADCVDYGDVLAAREEDDGAEPDSAKPAVRLAGTRVLVAEDAVDNQRLIRAILERVGVEVTSVEDGLLARDAALAARDAGEPFDLVLMDMQMPEMDGYEATGQLRQAGYTGPIVALTAHALEGECEKCLAAGCDAYARKPISRERLLGLVAQFARQAVLTVN